MSQHTATDATWRLSGAGAGAALPSGASCRCLGLPVQGRNQDRYQGRYQGRRPR